jgi:hypothetical protein
MAILTSNLNEAYPKQKRDVPNVCNSNILAMYHGEQFKIVACIFFQMPKSITEIK